MILNGILSGLNTFLVYELYSKIKSYFYLKF